MRLFIIVLLVSILTESEVKYITGKASKSKLPPNAIIAIQIIDPNENSTSLKNSKRTIESSLGYGYQDNFVGHRGPPKYEIYKYSQHDIPPYRPQQYTTSNYHVPREPPRQVQGGFSNSFQPGTILFSTINQQGKLGELTSHFPLSLENQQHPIPVIILRVHPDQLATPLFPKLPQSHLHASSINSIDINALLSNHIQNSVKQQPVVQQSQPIIQRQPIVHQQTFVQQQSANYHPQKPIYQPQSNVYQQQSEVYQQPAVYQQYQQDYQNNQENVPQQLETAQYQSPDYQSRPHYSQYQYDEGQGISDSGYQALQHVAEVPETQEVSGGSNYQYSKYQEPSPIYQRPTVAVDSYKSTELLTDENYPSDKHTQVIFKRSKGKSRTRNKHTHRSVLPVTSAKAHISSLETKTRKPEELEHSDAKYFQVQPNSNYYTIQHTEDQGYTHQKGPSYGVKEPSEESNTEMQVAQNRNYVYVSADGTYSPNV